MEFPVAFLLTNVLEIPIAYFFLRKTEKADKIIIAILLLNAITLPFVWFVFPALIKEYLPALIISEFVIFLIEAVAYAKIFTNSKHAWKVAILANLVSLLTGLLI
jgi:hypothetical protein